VTERLVTAGVPVKAVVNPLGGVAGVIRQTPGPVLAVGHSYGGAIITNAVRQSGNVAGLVYVAAFAPMRASSSSTASLRRRTASSPLR
jgi:pimeloyl-ACP methyl ester carboxylesterase